MPGAAGRFMCDTPEYAIGVVDLAVMWTGTMIQQGLSRLKRSSVWSEACKMSIYDCASPLPCVTSFIFEPTVYHYLPLIVTTRRYGSARH